MTPTDFDALKLQHESEQMEDDREAEEPDEDDCLCEKCGGSGEGMYEGAKCRTCGGGGGKPKPSWEERMEREERRREERENR